MATRVEAVGLLSLAKSVLLLIGLIGVPAAYAETVSTMLPSGLARIAPNGVLYQPFEARQVNRVSYSLGDQNASPAKPAYAVMTSARRPRPVLAVDVDETLCITDYTSLLWGIGKDKTKPLPGAQATMRSLAAKFDVIYVTARSRSLADKTRAWLNKFGFPSGRIVTSPTLGDFIFQSDFKRKAMASLKREYPNMVAGIGDKAKDAEAYRAVGIVPVIVNPWRNQKYRPDDNVCKNWSAVAAFFEANDSRLIDRLANRTVNSSAVFTDQ